MISSSEPLRVAVTRRISGGTSGPGGPELDEAARQQIIERLRVLSRLMDNAFTVPGTRIRFGLDPLLGLVPGVGDLLSAAVSGYIVREAARLGVPKYKLAFMVGNILIDAAVGAVPVLGDLFDVAFKANQRNLRLMGIEPKR